MSVNTLFQPALFNGLQGDETIKVQSRSGELEMPASMMFDMIASRVDALAQSRAASAVSGINVPQPGDAMPPGVADDGSVGSDDRYARSNHTHASKARKQIAIMPSASTTYVWTYPTPFAVGVVPVVSGIVQVPANTTDLFNVQIVGAPTRTQCTFQINRVSAGLLSLLTGALSINPQPIAATLHLIALEP